jgi:hypothetical protein
MRSQATRGRVGSTKSSNAKPHNVSGSAQTILKTKCKILNITTPNTASASTMPARPKMSVR